jgi:hypothetical protein
LKKENTMRGLLPILTVAAVTLVGCQSQSPEEKPVTTKTESSRTTADGTTTAKTETTQVGSTVETTTQSKTDTPQGAVRHTTNTLVGTVTRFTAGKSIEILTGNNKTHRFDLGEKDVVVNMDPSIAVGSKVQLIEEKGENGYHTISVALVS